MLHCLGSHLVQDGALHPGGGGGGDEVGQRHGAPAPLVRSHRLLTSFCPGAVGTGALLLTLTQSFVAAATVP